MLAAMNDTFAVHFFMRMYVLAAKTTRFLCVFLMSMYLLAAMNDTLEGLGLVVHVPSGCVAKLYIP